MTHRYYNSEQYLERALRSIPLGSQTFSKSRVQFPYGVSPYFIERGEGSKVWDIDGNEYVDFINALLSVLIGYNDPRVTEAVTKQIGSGVSFSLPHRIECEVAEMIVDSVPSAEMVRFGKNGTDATSAAMRLARAYTGRDHIVVCGYHGWQDWYIGSTSMNLGVPKAIQSLTHTFRYNDLPSLEKVFEMLPNQIAAVIMEPMNRQYPDKGFLQGVKDLAHKNGALLIFDEIITGFRFAKGGAQQLFQVTPDITCLGKGLANGFPLSAVMASKEIMNMMEKIFYSGTFGGEVASLAAAKKVLEIMNNEPVHATLFQRGSSVISTVSRLIDKHKLTSILSISGHPSWSFLNFQGTEAYSVNDIKTYYLQEIFERGLLSLGTHNISYAHREDDVAKLEQVYDQVFEKIHDSLKTDSLLDMLRAETIKPLFSTR